MMASVDSLRYLHPLPHCHAHCRPAGVSRSSGAGCFRPAGCVRRGQSFFAAATALPPAGDRQYARCYRLLNGMQIVPHLQYSDAKDAVDLLLVAGGPALPQHARDAALSEWLVQAAGRAGRYGSICNGAFLLAHAGLLNGKRVTTHWNDAAALARDFPDVEVDADRIYLRDGKLVTSAGVTAGIDLSLSLLAEDMGQEVALN